jgi:hypothetical protein
MAAFGSVAIVSAILLRRKRKRAARPFSMIARLADHHDSAAFGRALFFFTIS